MGSCRSKDVQLVRTVQGKTKVNPQQETASFREALNGSYDPTFQPAGNNTVAVTASHNSEPSPITLPTPRLQSLLQPFAAAGCSTTAPVSFYAESYKVEQRHLEQLVTVTLPATNPSETTHQLWTKENMEKTWRTVNNVFAHCEQKLLHLQRKEKCNQLTTKEKYDLDSLRIGLFEGEHREGDLARAAILYTIRIGANVNHNGEIHYEVNHAMIQWATLSNEQQQQSTSATMLSSSELRTVETRVKLFLPLIRSFAQLLDKLPPLHTWVYRGMKAEVPYHQYPVHLPMYWNSFSSGFLQPSCCENEEEEEEEAATMLVICSSTGRDISVFSVHPKRVEVVFSHNTGFRAVTHFLPQTHLRPIGLRCKLIVLQEHNMNHQDALVPLPYCTQLQCDERVPYPCPRREVQFLYKDYLQGYLKVTLPRLADDNNLKLLLPTLLEDFVGDNANQQDNEEQDEEEAKMEDGEEDEEDSLMADHDHCEAETDNFATDNINSHNTSTTVGDGCTALSVSEIGVGCPMVGRGHIKKQQYLMAQLLSSIKHTHWQQAATSITLLPSQCLLVPVFLSTATVERCLCIGGIVEYLQEEDVEQINNNANQHTSLLLLLDSLDEFF